MSFPSVASVRRAIFPATLTAALATLACSGSGTSGTTWQGTRQFGVTDSPYGVRVAVDSSRSVYLTVMTTISTSTGASTSDPQDDLLVRLDPAGNKRWSLALVSKNIDNPAGVALDSAGNVYVAAYKYDADGTGVFVIKFDGQGNQLWASPLGPDFGNVYDVVADPSGNVYIAGTTFETPDPSHPLDTPSFCYVAKLDASGAVVWSRQFEVPGSGLVATLTTGVDGSVVVVGAAYPDDAHVGSTATDLFVAKFDANSEMLWLRTLGTDQQESVYGVATDAGDNVYVSGTTGGALDGNINAGDADAYLVKYDAAGTKQWTRQLGTALTEYGVGVAVDIAGDVYMVGSTQGPIDGQPSKGTNDLFLVKYDEAGTQQWIRQYGTQGSEDPADMVSDPSGGVFVAGTTTAGLDGVTIPSRHEAFVMKFGPDGTIAGSSSPRSIGNGSVP